MKIKTLIRRLQKLDPNTEAVTYNAENGFYSAAKVYPKATMCEWHQWISIEGAPRPKKMVLFS